MKSTHKYLNQYLDIGILIGTSIIATTLHGYFNDQTEVLVGIYSIGITISISLRQYRIENDKLFKELFIMYNDKYDNKYNNKLNEIIDKTIINPEYSLNENEEQLITDYINMCAEQYLWKSKGRIDSLVWTSWVQGMKYYLDNPRIRKFIEKEKIQRESYYGFFEYLKL